MNIRNIERGPAPVRSALVELDTADIELLRGLVRRFAGKPSLFVRTEARRERARALLRALTREELL